MIIYEIYENKYILHCTKAICDKSEGSDVNIIKQIIISQWTTTTGWMNE